MNDTEIKSVEAEAFMASVREAQRKCGKSVTGCGYSRVPFDKRVYFEKAALEALTDLHNQEITLDDIILLAEHFEEMCHRRQLPMPQDLRPAIVRQLALELEQNHKIIRLIPGKLLRITSYNGAIAEKLVQFFPLFADKPWIIRRAAEHRPRDPLEFFQLAQEKSEDLIKESQNPESEWAFLANKPSTIIQTVINHVDDPRRNLRALRERNAPRKCNFGN